MSKNLFTIAATSLMSMLAGVAITLVFTAEALNVAVPNDGTDSLQDVATEMRKTQVRLDRIERVLDRGLTSTRRDVREALDRGAIAGAAPRGAAPGDSAAADTDTPNPHAVREDLAPLPGPNLAALGPMAGWAESEELRKKWMFASEKTSLETFGAPDEIAARGATETWTYWNDQRDGRIASEYRLKFNNGRLVRTQLVEWKKPRPKPTAQR